MNVPFGWRFGAYSTTFLLLLTVLVAAGCVQQSGGPVVTASASASASAAAPEAGNHAITEAIMAGDTAGVKALLDGGLNPNKAYDFKHPRWNMGKTTTKIPSTSVAMFGRLDILKLLFGHPKFRNSKVVSTHVLCQGVAHRHPEVVLFALKKGALVNPPGGCLDYWTPLQRARELALDDVAVALKKAGAR